MHEIKNVVTANKYKDHITVIDAGTEVFVVINDPAYKPIASFWLSVDAAQLLIADLTYRRTIAVENRSKL